MTGLLEEFLKVLATLLHLPGDQFWCQRAQVRMSPGMRSHLDSKICPISNLIRCHQRLFRNTEMQVPRIGLADVVCHQKQCSCEAILLQKRKPELCRIAVSIVKGEQNGLVRERLSTALVFNPVRQGNR